MDPPSRGFCDCAEDLPGGGGGVLSKGFCSEQGLGQVGRSRDQGRWADVSSIMPGGPINSFSHGRFHLGMEREVTVQE